MFGLIPSPFTIMLQLGCDVDGELEIHVVCYDLSLYSLD